MNKQEFQKKIGYSFSDISLLEEALTHPSISNSPDYNAINYERLEFLGDSVLGLLIAELLMKMYPEEREGSLAKRHSWLVKGETLTKIGNKLNIGEFLRMTGGEEQTGGRKTASNIEDAVEALLGAIYLDGGLPAAQEFISKNWTDIAKNIGEPPKDTKTELQELVQGNGLPLPSYNIISSEGPAHAPTFTVELIVKGFDPVRAEGSTRKKAEKAAAKLFIKKSNF